MATLTAQSKNAVTLTSQTRSAVGFLEKEDAFYLLLETGGHIVIEPNSGFFPTTASKNAVTLTSQTRH